MKYRNVKVNGKWVLKMPEHRAARPEWHTDAGWEKKRLDMMHKHIGKGDVVYYVGAELGEFPALCQKWGAKLLLFEPNHSAWPVIRGVWKANKLDRPLGLYAMFCGSETTLKPENPDKSLYGGHGWQLIKTKDSPDYDWPQYVKGKIIEAHGFSELHNEKDGLPVVTIDDVASHNLGPTVICMDIEGAEFEALKGAENTLLTYKPKIFLSLHPEFLIQYWNVYSREVRDWLIERGYDEKLIDYEHEVHLLYTPKLTDSDAILKANYKRTVSEI